MGTQRKTNAASTLPDATGNLSAAVVCGAVVVTFRVAVALDPFRVTCRVGVEDVPLAKLQLDSLALGSGVQERVTVPLNAPFGETVRLVEPLCPGLAIVTEAAGVTLNGPFTVNVKLGAVADK